MFPMYCIMQPSCYCSARLYTKPFQTESNVSNNDVDGVFTQEHTYFHKLIAFLSKILTSSEKNYSFHDCELLVIIAYCKSWHHYIDGQWTVVITDYKPLVHFYT